MSDKLQLKTHSSQDLWLTYFKKRINEKSIDVYTDDNTNKRNIEIHIKEAAQFADIIVKEYIEREYIDPDEEVGF